MFEKKVYSIGARLSNERELWASFLEGDLEAWEQIFVIYYKDLYGYGLKLSGQRELTKDCIHELFVILWNRRKNLAEVDSIKAYLLVSLRRNLLKKVKKRRRYYKDEENPVEQSSRKIQFSPEELIIKDEVKTERIEALYGAIDELPERQKEVLYLKYFNGMSYDEIEQILPIKYQSIKNHIYRAICNLREIMEDDITKTAISILLYLLLIH